MFVYILVKMKFYLILELFVFVFVICYGQADKASLIANQFGEASHTLVDYFLNGSSKGSGLRWLEPLVDDFGHRLTCSRQLEHAIDFTEQRLRDDGFDNVHTEKVKNLPRWVRGMDTVVMLEPRLLHLTILAVMGSATGSVKAPVVVLTEFAELQSVNVSGKIVVFAEQWHGYSRTVGYRSRSAKMVEMAGGVGVLIRSVTSFSLGTPHTGTSASDQSRWQHCNKHTNTKIPAACITVEEAELLKRLYRRGKQIVIRMDIKSKNEGKCTSRNTVFEIKGSEFPNEIVLLSGHMDTWDVGQGALDDGGGMAAVWQAMEGIKALAGKDKRFAPKRTIRGVFWTGEEQGYYGANAYFLAHNQNANEKFVFVSETDVGAFRPETPDSALLFSGNAKQREIIEEIVGLMNSVGIPLSVENSDAQGDVSVWASQGVPSVSYASDKAENYYFQFHHSNADYLNVFAEDDIDYTAAIFGVLAFVIANIREWP